MPQIDDTVDATRGFDTGEPQRSVGHGSSHPVGPDDDQMGHDVGGPSRGAESELQLEGPRDPQWSLSDSAEEDRPGGRGAEGA